MATRVPVSTEVDSPVAQPGNPTPAKLLSASDAQGFRPRGLAATPGPAAVDTTMSLGPARPSPGLTTQAHNHVTHQLSPLQHLGGGQTTVGHFSGSHTVASQGHLSSPHLSAQRQQQQQQQPQHIGGNSRQHPHHPMQMVSAGLASKISRSQVEIRRRDAQMESRAHPIVTRPVANMGQPAQGGSPAVGLGGSQLGKPQGLMLHRPQGSPQDKGGHLQKPTTTAQQQQRQVIQRAHTRTASWQQTPLGQHTPGTPSGQQSRMFHPHPVLNAQTRSSPQEQGRQHPALPQQFSQLQQLGPTGVKSLPMYPVLRTPVAGNHTSNHNDTAYRERLFDSQIVVHIGDRKVRLVSESDPSSLYSLCRRWMRNDIPRADRTGVRDVMNVPLPRPLSVTEVENAGDYGLDNGTRSDHEQCQPEIEKPVDCMTDEELLQSHVQHFKTVRKRSKEERMRRIARFKPRLALLLPGNNE